MQVTYGYVPPPGPVMALFRLPRPGVNMMGEGSSHRRRNCPYYFSFFLKTLTNIEAPEAATATLEA